MIDALTHLCVEAEASGFQVEAVWPAGRPRYLVFEIIGDTTPRGLAAAIELREMFAADPAHAESLFEYLLSTGALLHPVTDPQKLFPAGTKEAAPAASTPSAALPAWNDLPDVCRSAMCRAVEFHECDGQAALDVYRALQEHLPSQRFPLFDQRRETSS